MIQQPHDQFAKRFLSELLDPFGGEIKTNYEIYAQQHYVDIYYLPDASVDKSSFQKLGLLGEMVQHACLLEAFRSPPTVDDVHNCLFKLLSVYQELQKRQEKLHQKPLDKDELPNLWILATSVYQPLLDCFEVKTRLSQWCEGIYFLGECLKTAIVDIRALPSTPETLFLRLLGKGATQKQAIEEILAYPVDHQLRQYVLELLAVYRIEIGKIDTQTSDEDEELFMRLSPAYLKWREETLQEGIEQDRCQWIENLLKSRFGALDDELKPLIEPLSQLPVEESSRLLLQASREELLARFKH